MLLVALSTTAVVPTASSPGVRYQDGYCYATPLGEEGSCDTGRHGAWDTAVYSIRNMQHYIRKCLRCANCNFVSYTAQQNDCSWYSRCPMHNLYQGHGAVTASVHPEFRRKAVLYSTRYSKAGAAKALKGAELSRQAATSSHSAPHAPLSAGQISGVEKVYASSPRRPQLSGYRGIGRHWTDDLLDDMIARHRLSPADIGRVHDRLTRLLEGERADPSLLANGNPTLRTKGNSTLPSFAARQGKQSEAQSPRAQGTARSRRAQGAASGRTRVPKSMRPSPSSCALLEQTSIATCTLGVSFGCDAASQTMYGRHIPPTELPAMLDSTRLDLTR